MTNSLSPLHADAYRRRARVITAYGLISLIVGTAGLIDRDLLTSSSAVQTLDGPVVVVWLGLQVAGGGLAALGVRRLRPDVELVGLWLLFANVAINGSAILLNRGPVGGGVTSASMVLVAYVLHGRIGDLHDAARTERRVVNLRPARDRRHR